MHARDEEPVVRHYLKANRLSTPLGFSQFGKGSYSGVRMRVNARRAE